MRGTNRLPALLARVADRDIYPHIWPNCTITRVTGGGDLDKYYAIDVLVRVSQGMSLTVQEKCRGWDKRRHNDFTLEYWNDPETYEPGEWFNLCADLYLSAYANQDETAIAEWRLFKVVDLKLAVERGEVRFGRRQIPNRAHGKATFRPLLWRDLPPVALIASNAR